MRPLPVILVSLASLAVLPALPPQPAVAAGERLVSYTQWDTRAELKTGIRDGLRTRKGALVLDGAGSHRSYRGTRYDVGTWTGPWTTPGYGFTQLIASWSATTPRNSWVEVRARVASGSAKGRWQVLGRWASADKHVRRTSVAGQSDSLGRVDVDTWKAATSTGVTAYQLQARLMRKSGAHSAPPSMDVVGAVASQLPSGAPSVSAPGPASGVVLDVPRYSQMVHSGEFPQYGGGGEAWCSPTSVAMVLGYYGRLPSASAYGWVGPRVDPWVDEVARRTYDSAYDGTGNWPFNTAYAASMTGDAFVTRLRSLREAEDLVVAGIPVVASVAFPSGALSGAPISSTPGHVLVIVGFTSTGDVVVNDPAASSSSGVRRTYDRAQFESAWLGGSGGTAYVIRDDAHPLPASPGTW